MKKFLAFLLTALLLVGSVQTAAASPLSPAAGLKYIVDHGAESARAVKNGNIGVFAGETGSITINNLNGSATVKVYRMVNISKVDNNVYEYTLNAADFSALFETWGVNRTSDFADKLETERAEIISATQNFITEKGLAPYKQQSVAAEASSVTLNGLAYGFYYVGIESTENEGTIYNPMLLLVPDIQEGGQENPAVSANAKSSKPTLDKKIKKGEILVDEATMSIGQIVNYEISVLVPKYTAKVQDEDVVFILEDTMSKGLTYRYDVAVKAPDGTVLADDVFKSKQVVKNENSTVLTFTFDYAKIKQYADVELTVAYSAILNENAVIGAPGNDNSVTLEYTNDPKAGTTHKTTPEETTVYTFGLDITKYELGDRTRTLVNAEFTLETKDGGKTVYFKEAAGRDNTYIAVLDDGTYTLTQTEDGTFTAAAQINGETVQITGLKNVVATGAGGKLIVEGLGEGTYILKETKAPENYFIYGSPFEIEIKAETSGGVMTGNVAKESEGNEAAESGTYYVKWIANTTEYVLPGTGGIGTIVFLGISILTGAAAFILLYRRRGNKA